MSGNFFRGTSNSQDTRFSNKETKLLQSTKFPPCFSTKVDLAKVNLSVIKPWITERITSILGFEDEVVIEYVFGLLEESSSSSSPDPRKIQINLGGFLTEENAAEFVLDLWKLLISAQESLGGIPRELIERKKVELREKKRETERIARQFS